MKKGLLMTTTTMSLEQPKKLGHICGWAGCSATFSGDMPKGWTNLICYWSKQPILDIRKIEHWIHDKTLCPEHTRTLDGMLKDFGRRLASSPPAGVA